MITAICLVGISSAGARSLRGLQLEDLWGDIETGGAQMSSLSKTTGIWGPPSSPSNHRLADLIAQTQDSAAVSSGVSIAASAPGCTDKYWFCPLYKPLCGGVWKGWMATNCPAACDKCTDDTCPRNQLYKVMSSTTGAYAQTANGQIWDAESAETAWSNFDKNSNTDNNVQGTIVGGAEVPSHKYSFLASWVPDEYRNRHNIRHWCGGSVIGRRAVLTAAHCFFTPSRRRRIADGDAITVRVGAHDLDDANDGTPIAVASFEIHERWNADRSFNADIAILHLARDVPASVAPIALDRGDPVAAAAGAGTLMTTAGWGALMERGASPSRPHEVDVPAVTNAVCEASYAGRITAGMVCAGYAAGGRDACQGDSGGPLWVKAGGGGNAPGADSTSGVVLTGVTSWGVGCARRDKYGVYARVASYADWIDERTGAFAVVPGRGWCQEADGAEATARYFVRSSAEASAACSADPQCAGYAAAATGGDAVVYTSAPGKCTHGCSNTRWQVDPSRIAKAGHAASQPQWAPAQCYAKRTAQAYRKVPGRGWCQEADGAEATARYFVRSGEANAACSADTQCAGFAAVAGGDAVVYTSAPGKCTHGCSNTRWQVDPARVTKAGYLSSQPLWANAECFVKV